MTGAKKMDQERVKSGYGQQLEMFIFSANFNCPYASGVAVSQAGEGKVMVIIP